MQVIVNFGTAIPALIMMLQGFVMLIGLYFVGSALIEIWGVSNDNALKFLRGNQRYSIGSAIITMIIGSLLLAMGTLELVAISSRTLTGGYVSSRITADALSYTPGGGGGLREKAELVTLALLAIMQMVGFIAMTKGWLTINAHYNHQGQASLGQGIGFIVGGILAWNFKWFSDLLNNQLGFNLIGMMTPFS